MGDSVERPVCLWWGDLERREFQPAHRRLQSKFRLVPGDQAYQGPSPQLLICALAQPDLSTVGQAEKAAADWPEARLVILSGAWGSAPKSAGESVTWEAASVWSGGIDPLADRPQVQRLDAGRCLGSVMLACHDADLAEGLAEAVAGLGWTGWWCPPGSPVHASGPLTVVWDVPRQVEQRREELERLRGIFPQARFVALVDFGRHEELQQLLRWGVAAALSKPPRPLDLQLALEGD